MSDPDPHPTRATIRRRWPVIAGLLLAVLVGLLVLALTGGNNTTNHGASPKRTAVALGLTTPVEMSNGLANSSAVVVEGDARIEVLSPTLLRLEYSPTATFENSPTVNVLDRRMPVPKYTSSISRGWLTIRTTEATLRYKVGSGPFTPANTSVSFSDGGKQTDVSPTWDWECPFDQVCQAGAATIGGTAQIAQMQGGFESDSGYINFIYRPASATWDVIGAPSGSSALWLRFSNVENIFGPAGAHTFALVVNGRFAGTMVVPATPGTTDRTAWSTVRTTVMLHSGTNSIEAVCNRGDSCDLDLDTLSIAPIGEPEPKLPVTDPLGGWLRGFDTYTYSPPGNVACAPGTSGATCVNTTEPLHTDGLLDRAGWRLLDDTQSAVWNSKGWVEPRPANGDLEDGYLFVYGNDYTGALRTFDQLTGPPPLLPRDVFGVWYSDYTPYSSAYIEDNVYPGFVRNGVPLNTLSLDTDWKGPNSWNGWEWNRALFPDPTAFLAWAKSHGIDVTLNIHSSIADDDPRLPTAERIAKTPLASSDCSDDGPCKVWDWSSESQAESNFALQQTFLDQGVSFWWLDWCCDDSVVSMPGLTPDSWIDHLYAQDQTNLGERGFVLARVGSSNGFPEQVYPAGPWSDHTSTVAFTGDAWGTWTQLAAEVALTPDEATIGEPYVSDDIGSYLGPPPTQAAQDPPDLYDRWVQFGTFQPILRLHSDNLDRLPWEFPEPVAGITENFLRLREALVPYTYTLAYQAYSQAMPIAQPLYLQYPDQAEAYTNPEEYLYGSDMLVSPVLSPGADPRTTVWFPPGKWVDYFTGATFDGPATETLSVPLDRMPVFVKAGGIVPEQKNPSDPRDLDLKVYAGSSGRFDLYDDSGTGLGYQNGQYTETEITDSSGAGRQPANVSIAAATGHYPGEEKAIDYEVDIVDLSDPSLITLNGKTLSQTSPGSDVGGTDAAGWYYDSSTHTVVVSTGSQPNSQALSIVATGGQSLNLPEPS
jgi:Glycosyl hydrolases family 31/Domain of unknown function (DUF5110)